MKNHILCGTHGKAERRYLCDHLWKLWHRPDFRPSAYYLPNIIPGEPLKFVWCNACEEVILREGSINSAALDFANVHTLCQWCFQTFLDANFAAEG